MTELITTYFHDTVQCPSWMSPLLGAVFPAGLFVAVVIPGAWYVPCHPQRPPPP